MDPTILTGVSSPPMHRAFAEFRLTIALGATVSDVMETRGLAFGSLQLPSAFTGSTLSVQFSNDGVNFTEVTETGDEENPLTVTVNKTYFIPSQAFASRYIRVVSGSAEAAARTIVVIAKG